jgi:hypothetical protein
MTQDSNSTPPFDPSNAPGGEEPPTQALGPLSPPSSGTSGEGGMSSAQATSTSGFSGPASSEMPYDPGAQNAAGSGGMSGAEATSRAGDAPNQSPDPGATGSPASAIGEGGMSGADHTSTMGTAGGPEPNMSYDPSAGYTGKDLGDGGMSGADGTSTSGSVAGEYGATHDPTDGGRNPSGLSPDQLAASAVQDKPIEYDPLGQTVAAGFLTGPAAALEGAAEGQLGAALAEHAVGEVGAYGAEVFAEHAFEGETHSMDELPLDTSNDAGIGQEAGPSLDPGVSDGGMSIDPGFSHDPSISSFDPGFDAGFDHGMSPDPNMSIDPGFDHVATPDPSMSFDPNLGTDGGRFTQGP